MYNRKLYIEKIRPFIRKPVIKVITGMRRTGKSCLMRLVIEELKASGMPAKNILYVNKESLDFDFIRTYSDLAAYVKKYFSGARGIK